MDFVRSCLVFALIFVASGARAQWVSNFSLTTHLVAEIPGVGRDEESITWTEVGSYMNSNYVEVTSLQGGAYGGTFVGGYFPWIGTLTADLLVEVPTGRAMAETTMTADFTVPRPISFLFSYTQYDSDSGSGISVDLNGLPWLRFSGTGDGESLLTLNTGDVFSVTRTLIVNQIEPGSRNGLNNLWIEGVPEPSGLAAFAISGPLFFVFMRRVKPRVSKQTR